MRLAVLSAAALSIHSAAAETRSYVVSWFTLAMYDQDGDCPGGVNPSIGEIYRQNLKDMGRSPEDIERLLKALSGGKYAAEVTQLMVNRGRIDGKPVNVYQNPESYPDDNLHTVEGKYSYGFNLDGKGAASPNSFEDPETHEKGVNNQYFRAMGCIQSHRAYAPEKSAYWQYVWDGARDTVPAWLISLNGADLSKDGEVTVTFDRAIEHIIRDARGEPAVNSTFRTDPDPRWHTGLKGRIKDGVLTTEPGNLLLAGDPFIVTEFDFRQTRLRLKMLPDGSLDGLLGGYEPWLPIYFFYGGSGYVVETMSGIDMPGVYYALKKLADAYPDPKTGVNMFISAAYKIEAVPAFVVATPRRESTQAGDPVRKKGG